MGMLIACRDTVYYRPPEVVTGDASEHPHISLGVYCNAADGRGGER